MSENSDAQATKTASEKLAELVAQRNADRETRGRNGFAGRRQSERLAAARSLSRSKPATRK
jgi:hypothetical protein